MYGRSVAGAKHVGDVISHVLAGFKPTCVGIPRRCRLREEVRDVHASELDWRSAR